LVEKNFAQMYGMSVFLHNYFLDHILFHTP
jgi:hypothetical protein